MTGFTSFNRGAEYGHRIGWFWGSLFGFVGGAVSGVALATSNVPAAIIGILILFLVLAVGTS